MLLATMVIATFRLTHEGVWVDEAYTWALSQHTVAKILAITVAYDTHPPLYYLAVKAFRYLGGDGIGTIRALSVLGAIALVGLGLGPLRRAAGDRAGLGFCLLAMTTPNVLAMAQDGRMYMWAVVCVTGTVIYAYLAGSGQRRRDWIACGGLTLGAAYLHYYAFLAVAITHLLLLGWLLKERLPLRAYGLTVGAVALSLAPWLPNLIAQVSRVKGDFWAPPITWELLRDVLLHPYGDKFAMYHEAFPLKGLAFAVACVVAGMGLWRQSRSPGKAAGLHVLAPTVYALTLLTAIAVSFLMRPILIGRFMSVTVGLLILTAALSLPAIRSQSLSKGLLAVMIGLNLTGMASIYRHRFNGPMGSALAAVQDKIPTDATFVHLDWESMRISTYYLAGHKHFLYEPESNGTWPDAVFPNCWAGNGLATFLQGNKHLWYLSNTDSDATDPPSYLPPGFRLADRVTVFRHPFSGYTVWIGRIERTP